MSLPYATAHDALQRQVKSSEITQLCLSHSRFPCLKTTPTTTSPYASPHGVPPLNDNNIHAMATYMCTCTCYMLHVLWMALVSMLSLNTVFVCYVDVKSFDPCMFPWLPISQNLI